ncbi:MAG: hypothetical protein AAFV45_05240 [Pseudomonadota bacterium]
MAVVLFNSYLGPVDGTLSFQAGELNHRWYDNRPDAETPGRSILT